MLFGKLHQERKGILAAVILGTGLLTVMLLFLAMPSAHALGAEKENANKETEKLAEYQEYRKRLLAVENLSDMEENGFQVMEEHIFPIETDCFGTVNLIPAKEKAYRRMVLFLAREDGRVVYRTDQLEVNNRRTGELEQSCKGLSAVSFQDLNQDNRVDIVLITVCVNRTGGYAGKPYKIGDVLFQEETGFYSDYRISDKMNRFGMNKSVECITSYVKGMGSTEFLYTASTKKELLENGFVIANEQCYPRQFEKLGYLEVVPGSYTMADYSTFMIYLVNEQGYIVWSFQPMGDYDNLYALKGITCKDIDGDGLKDILVLARYSYEGSSHELVTESDYSIYYQRTGGFDGDTEVKKRYPCDDEDTVAELVEKARNYWGWQA